MEGKASETGRLTKPRLTASGPDRRPHQHRRGLLTSASSTIRSCAFCAVVHASELISNTMAVRVPERISNGCTFR